jgi:hypothetical protein
MNVTRLWTAAVSAIAVAACSTASAPAPTTTAATGPSIEVDRLETMLHAFAHDSMMGREAGTEGHLRATRYLADRARAFGLEPAGEDGTYLQEVPMVERRMTSSAQGPSGAIEVGPDFAPLVLEDLNSPSSLELNGIPVVYGGDMASPGEISAAEAAGKIVVLGAAQGPQGRAFGLVGPTLEKLSGAEAILMASLDYASSDIMEFLIEPQVMLDEGDGAEGSEGEGPFLAFVSESLVERLFGAGVDALQAGAEGPALSGAVGPTQSPVAVPTYNVVARVPGSDPALSDEHVVLSAHSDHTGFTLPPVSHDSLRAYLEVVRPGGADDPERAPTPAEAERIEQIRASLAGPARLDSINNGADDDGSGSVALLEIGRVLAAAPEGPRRSVLLVWHTAEEGGLIGSRYYTDNPTVPIEQMVATVNVDMIGRGTPGDQELGGPGYLQLIGSRRLSSELGDLVERVNEQQGHGMDFDYSFDADGHPSNFYCRSDHYMYARYGVPVVFMTTGGHRDYHMRTDEAQYIDYSKLAQVAGFVRGLIERVANLDQRPVVDGPIPDPNEPCQQ